MKIINKVKNLFTETTNDIDISEAENYKKKIKSFNKNQLDEYLSNTPNEDLEIIKNIIFNFGYSKHLNNIPLKLYKYTDIRNLVFSAFNLIDVVVQKLPFYRMGTAFYDSENNVIVFSEKEDLPHEFMHLASTSPIIDDSCNVGFAKVKNGNVYGNGLTEGYTEMISKRIYFDEDYNTNAYKLNVYLTLILECLYDDKKDMERDYFKADLDNLRKVFLRYGSKQEFEKLIHYLDIYNPFLDNEFKLKTINFIKEIVYRTDDTNKIEQAENYAEEYIRSIK